MIPLIARLRRKQTHSNRTIAAVLLTLFCAHSAFAASITWQPVSYISGYASVGTTDVDTVGSLIFAVNNGPNSVPNISAIPFSTDPFVGLPLSGSLTNPGSFGPENFSLNSLSGVAGSLVTMSATATALPPQYQTLLRTAAISMSSMTLVLTGLTPSMQYRLELWVHSSNSNLTENISDGTNAVTLQASVTGFPNPFAHENGEWVIGTFTADPSGIQQVSITNLAGVGAPTLLNGFQLRAVPEPSSLALGSFGAVALICAAAKNRRHFLRNLGLRTR